MATLQPPLIADILSYLLLAALFYLLIYAIILRKELLSQMKIQKKMKPHSSIPAPTSKMVKIADSYDNAITKPIYYIEPSPIPGQKIPFPSIFRRSEISLSIIVPVHNMQNEVFNIYEKIQTYFYNKSQNSIDTFTYEVIIVDINSSDNTYQISYDYAIQNPEFRILRLTENNTLSMSLAKSVIRTRGKRIFLYLPQENIPLSLFDQLDQKMNSSIDKNHNEAVVVLPCFEKIAGNTHSTHYTKKFYTNKKDDDIQFENNDSIVFDNSNDGYYQTLFSSFIEYLTNKLLFASMDINPKVVHHYSSILLTREAARDIFYNLKYEGNAFDPEVLLICDMKNMPVKCVMLPYGVQNKFELYQTSWMRLETLLSLVECLILYKLGLWTINYRREF